MYDTDRDSGYTAELHCLASELGLAQRVHFEGFRDDVGAVMRSLDVVTHCSTDPEPFGRVVVEGMACARPVVAAAAGGVTEIINDGVDGLLYPMGDVRALSAAILRLLDDEELRLNLGAAGRRTVMERFTAARYINDIQQVYDELVVDGTGARTLRT